MLDKLREQMVSFLSTHQNGVLATSGLNGAWAMPVTYSNRGLEVDCLIPRWADVAFHLEQDPRVLLIVADPLVGVSGAWRSRPGLRWMQYAGSAQPITNPHWGDSSAPVAPLAATPRDQAQLEILPSSKDWALEQVPPLVTEDLYLLVRLSPQRIDLIDESRGWGARETLET